DRIGLVLHRDLVHELGDLRETAPGVLAHAHRRRSGVALLAGDGALDPAQALAVRDDANVLAFGLENRALLDVQFEQRMDLARADLLVALPADALELVAETEALGVLAVIGPVERVNAGEDAGGEHGGREARALLVGPVDDDDGAAGFDAEVVERADDLEPAQHAEDTVVATAGRLRVEVAADIDGVEVRLGAFAAREHRPHLVDADGHPRGLAPAPEQVPALAVGVGERLAI